jgi:hypothetical protein
MTTDGEIAQPQQTGDISIWWYAVALAIYIPLGFLTQSVVLNWIVGPIFPLLVLYVGPTFARRIVSRVRAVL